MPPYATPTGRLHLPGMHIPRVVTPRTGRAGKHMQDAGSTRVSPAPGGA